MGWSPEVLGRIWTKYGCKLVECGIGPLHVIYAYSHMKLYVVNIQSHLAEKKNNFINPNKSRHSRSLLSCDQ